MMKQMMVLLALSTATAARAEITYLITVDTSSQLANPGVIDFQLNPGTLAPVPPVTAAVQFLTGLVLDGTSIATSGDTSGTLPGTLTLNNDVSPGAEYTQDITSYGATVSFYLTLSGSGVNQSGAAGGLSGTTFLLDFNNFPASQYLFTNDPNGDSTSATDPAWAVLAIDVDGTGVVTTYTNPGPCTGGSCATITEATLPTNGAPEPSTGLLLAGTLLAVGFWRRGGRLRR